MKEAGEDTTRQGNPEATQGGHPEGADNDQELQALKATLDKEDFFYPLGARGKAELDKDALQDSNFSDSNQEHAPSKEPVAKTEAVAATKAEDRQPGTSKSNGLRVRVGGKLKNLPLKRISAIFTGIMLTTIGVYFLVSYYILSDSDLSDTAHTAKGPLSFTPSRVSFLDLAPFFIMINDLQKGESFLRITIALELRGEDLQEEIAQENHRIRREITNLLSQKLPDDILGMEKIESLQREIRVAINGLLHKKAVYNVYFQDFLFL